MKVKHGKEQLKHRLIAAVARRRVKKQREIGLTGQNEVRGVRAYAQGTSFGKLGTKHVTRDGGQHAKAVRATNHIAAI